MKKGNIIFLNGVSSSGKTTLAKKIQEKSNSNLAWISIDTFCNMWLEKRFEENFLKLIYRYKQLCTIQSGFLQIEELV